MTDAQKPTEQSLFSRFVSLFHEQATIVQDIKALNDEYKELYEDADLATIKAVAKAKADEIKGSAYMIKVLCFLFDTKYHMHYIISF